MADDFLALAQDAYSESSDFFDAGVRLDIEQDLRQFQGQHPHGSRYLSESYRSRSKFFRPKTRAAVRKNEAIATEAFFSNPDVVKIEPEDQTNPEQVISAAVWHEVMNYRLEKTIPWFQTVIGAYQDAMVTGVCISYQSWRMDKLRGIDEPSCELLPPENFRFSPTATWTNVVKTSPYLVRLIPMYVKDVRARMKTGEDTKLPGKHWKMIDETAIMTAAKSYSDSITMQRNARRADPANASRINAFSMVWVHQNFIEVNGLDWMYYTLATNEMLSDPVLVEDRFSPLDGERPFVVGNCVIETHKVYPPGSVRLGRDIQGELNANANNRIDNVNFAMNKRYFVKRGRQVDLRSLQRNVPGSATLMEDPENDVKVQETGDVTSSAYEEQDRLNLDFDDLVGTFSQASAQSSRRIVDSKGGLEQLTSESSMMGKYQLKTFAATWAVPVVRQLLKFEQAFETDEKIFTLAGKKAAKAQRRNDPIIVDDALLSQELTAKVSVGSGATSPKERAATFTDVFVAIKAILEDDVITKNGGDAREIVTEVLTILGMDGADRFFPDKGEDPKIAQLQQELDDAMAKLAKREDPELTKAKIAKLIAETDKLGASKVGEIVKAIFGSMQVAEVIAAVPQVSPIADQVMKAGGYQEPKPAGIDPGFAPGEQGPNVIAQAAPAPGLTVNPIVDQKTGVGFTPPGALAAPPGGGLGEDHTPGIPTSTDPMSPAAPAPLASPMVGPNAGIETMRPDTQGAKR